MRTWVAALWTIAKYVLVALSAVAIVLAVVTIILNIWMIMIF